jgi:hypothetical protein
LLLAGEHTPISDQTQEKQKQSGSSWYSRLSAEKRAEYLDKLRASRQMKGIVALNLESLYEPTDNHDQGKQYYFE